MSKKNNKNRFNEAIEGIGDILSLHAKQRKFTIVKEGIERLCNIAKEINKRNLLSNKNSELSSSYQDKFSLVISQLIRINEEALKNDNEEISADITINIIKLLELFSREKNNEDIIRQLLNTIYKTFLVSLKINPNTARLSSIEWFFHIVYSPATAPIRKEYFGILGSIFFQVMQYIIKYNQEEYFKSFVRKIHNVYCYPDISGKLHSLIKLSSNTDNLYSIASELTSSMEDLCTDYDLQKWDEKFDNIKKLVLENSNSTNKPIANTLINEISCEVEKQFYYNCLIRMSFDIGACCLFYKQYHFIKYFLEYKQPRDADGDWCGREVIPDNIDELLRLYPTEKQIVFFEDHHGIELYLKQYFLVLLSNIINQFSSETPEREIKSSYSMNLPARKLGFYNSLLEELKKIAEDLKEDKIMFFQIGITGDLNEFINNKLIPTLDDLKVKADKSIKNQIVIQKISPRKIEEFKKNVVTSFHISTTIRNIFVKHLEHYETPEHILTEDKERLGIETSYDKEAFLEDWFISYQNIGMAFGVSLAENEDDVLLEEILKYCKEEPFTSFEDFANKIKPEDMIIFSSHAMIWDFFDKIEPFQHVNHNNEERSKMHSLKGRLEIGTVSIPVFDVRHNQSNDFLLLDKTKIGKIVQNVPVWKEEDKNDVFDKFFIKIRSFSENENLTNELLKSKPDWLLKKGNEEAQKNYLLTKVMIQIYEAFDYIPEEEMIGYIVKLNDE